MAFLRFGKENVVIGVDEYCSLAGIEETVEFGLGADNALETAETLEVSLAHAGDKPEVRLSDIAEEVNLARVVGTHLNHCDLTVGRDGEKCERHAKVVVEVASGCVHTIATAEHGGKQLFGGGLAVGAGYAYNGYG